MWTLLQVLACCSSRFIVYLLQREKWEMAKVSFSIQVVALGDLLNGGKPDWAILKQGDRLRFVNGRIDYGLKSLQELLAGPVQKEALQLHQTAKQVTVLLGGSTASVAHNKRQEHTIFHSCETISKL